MISRNITLSATLSTTCLILPTILASESLSIFIKSTLGLFGRLELSIAVCISLNCRVSGISDKDFRTCSILLIVMHS